MNSIAPNNNIAIPTAKKVNPTRIGLRKLDLIERRLAPTSGFFFGNSYATEEDIEYRMADDMEKIDLMLQAIEDKATIYYTSSW